MQTCRSLYLQGAKFLLYEVVLSDEKHFPSFLECMRAAAASSNLTRWQYLDFLELEVGCIIITPDTAELLYDIFNGLLLHSRLRRLSIMQEDIGAETLLRSHTGLAQCIAGLTTLQGLCISQCGPRTCTMLRSMRSALVNVWVALDYEWELNEDDEDEDEDEDEGEDDGDGDGDGDGDSEGEGEGDGDGDGDDNDDEWLIQDFTRLFPTSQTSLKTLEVRFSKKTFSGGLVYPNVTDLCISAPRNPPEMSHYIHSFPNLRQFVTHADDTVDPGEEALLQHAANRSIQEQRGSWSSLEYYYGDMSNVFWYGFTFHIMHLEVRVRNPDEVAMLQEALPTVRPITLTLWLGSGAVDKVMEEQFVTSLCESRTPQLQTLSLTVLLNGRSESPFDLEAFLVSTVLIIIQVRSTHPPSARRIGCTLCSHSDWYPLALHSSRDTKIILTLQI